MKIMIKLIAFHTAYSNSDIALTPNSKQGFILLTNHSQVARIGIVVCEYNNLFYQGIIFLTNTEH
ncbi:hypothetical protein T266_11760 [Pseudomonas aeruginosa VRFPA05]|nr:hypothetical protein T266_11760 [Pseudomonas aeruginosa VRFPA05]